MLVTSYIFDLVILEIANKRTHFLSLTCSFETNIFSANALKTLRYTILKINLEDYCNLIPFGVGSRGYVSKSNKANLINVIVTNSITANILKCIKIFYKIAAQ